MTYDIYFHNDFDGRASAAVMLAFLRERGDDIERYVSMTYGKESAWYNEDFFTQQGKNPVIVVDFTYHPKAAWWFDHHASTFKKPEWKSRYQKDKQHQLSPEYPSCCGLVQAALQKNFGWKPPRHFAAFVKSADMLDGAGYRSARQTIEMKGADLQMNAFIEGFPHTEKEDRLIVELMSKYPLANIVKHPTVAKALAKLNKKVAKSLELHRKNIRVSHNITFIDLKDDPMNGLLRYAPYYLYPKTKFAIRMRPKGKLWYLGVGVNPWRKPANYPDLGALMRRYHGGGHKGIGATEFHSKKEAMKAVGEIIERLKEK
jgi:hypothetical protein